MKKYLLGLCAAAVLHGAPVLAQSLPPVDPAAAAAVKEMLDAMKYRDTLRASFHEMQKSMPAMMLQGAQGAISNNKSLTDEQKKLAMAKVEERVGPAAAALANTMNDPALFEEMLAEIIPLYARYFSAAEIAELAAFYRTPLGVKMMATLPQIAAESMQIGQKVMMPRVVKAIEKVAEGQ